MISIDSNAEQFADKTRGLPGFKNFSLPGVKEKVAEILDMIGRVEGIFSTYAKHDISHIDAMLGMLDWLIPPSTQEKMTSVDWLLTVLSIYFHDLGLVVTNEEYTKRMDNPVFKEFFEGLDKDLEGRDYIARTEKMTDEEKDRFFYQEFVRKQHATRIREWISGRHSSQWGDSVKSITEEIVKIMEDLPTRFRENLATVCESHHKDDLDKVERYPLCQHYGSHSNEVANVQYSAILLRTTDLLHVTKDRTPSVMYKTIRLSDPMGVEAWKTQKDTFSVFMEGREFDENDTKSHVIVVAADFTEEKPYFALTEYLAYADRQVKQSKIWAEMSQDKSEGKYYSFPWYKVKDDILVEGNEPETMSFELDKGKLLDLLVGHTIYNDPTVAVRELLQNAIDAVRFQHHLEEISEGKTKQITGKVMVKWDPEERELIVEDSGIGMDLNVIKSHLMSVGSSFYDSSTFHSEHADFTPISRFGIGILTCFMVSDDIEIITFKKDVGYRIRMSSVHARYLVKKLESGHPTLSGLEPHGTIVKLKLRSSIDFKDQKMIDIVRHWIILPECKIIYSEKKQKPQPIGFETPEQVLEHFHFRDSSEKIKTKGSYEIIKSIQNENGESYELAFAVGKGFTPERNFIGSSNFAPVVCIEGIRADESLPNFKHSPYDLESICAILSVRGNKRFRTTVSRTNLEKDEEYNRVGEICGKLLFDHLENEVDRIAEQNGKPLSQASTAGLWIYNYLRKVSQKEIQNYISNRYLKLPLLVIENMDSKNGNITSSRKLISHKQLKKLSSFWTIESRMVDYLGIISRDLGRELSLNEFLNTLAPEYHDISINPVISDAHQFSDGLLLTHRVNLIKFSREHQQTVIEWKLKKDESDDDSINLKSLLLIEEIDLIKKHLNNHFDYINIRRYGREEYLESLDKFTAAIAPTKGDVGDISIIKTRMTLIFKANSKVAEVWTALKSGIVQLSTEKRLEEISLLCIGCQYITDAIRNREYYSSESQLNEKWSNLSNELNNLFEGIGINCQVPANFKDIIGDEYTFDASRYWFNWINY